MSNRDFQYQYIICSPPDFIHLSLLPENTIEYANFIKEVFARVSSSCDVVTIVTTDRKASGKIYCKHSIITNVFQSLGFDLISQKIWVKSLGEVKNRLSYSICLTFSRGSYVCNGNMKFRPDVFVIETESVDGYTDNYPVSLVRLFVEEFTNSGDTVYDPFMGTGSTAIGATLSNRVAIGSEKDLDMFNICCKRISFIK